jgi:3-deoxy-D-manno-octulosonate 8-phosphate phosphatase KdsC-like HAD superfamily phosphatase
MNVLSLFDGMSCGQLALTKANIEYHSYYASEIDDSAMRVAKHNFPNMIHIGNVLNIKTIYMFKKLAEAEIQERLKNFKGLILDGDGVWFTGDEYRGVVPSTGEAIIFKSRHHHDGQGLTFMRALGLKVLFATAEGEPMTSVVSKLNNLPSVKKGVFGEIDALTGLQRAHSGTKVEAIEEWLQKNNLTWDECLYVGDDRTDWGRGVPSHILLHEKARTSRRAHPGVRAESLCSDHAKNGSSSCGDSTHLGSVLIMLDHPLVRFTHNHHFPLDLGRGKEVRILGHFGDLLRCRGGHS